MVSRPVLYLVDGHAVAYRQYHALSYGNFSTRTGEVTNAIFGFTRLLLDILQKDRPKYLAVAFDKGLSGREKVYGEYKAQREEMPEDLQPQMPRIEEMVRAFNIPVLTMDGYEADDIIGTVTSLVEAQGTAVHIITGDRDLLQLLSPNVTVQLPSRGSPDVVYDMARFEERYQGITTEQYIDLKALMGDNSDNIPGVKGIGEKTGIELLHEFGTLENIYANLDSIKGAKRKKLEADKDNAFLSQELSRIMRDLPIEIDLAQCVSQDYDHAKVDQLFGELEFRTLRDRLKEQSIEQLPLFAVADSDSGNEVPEAVVPFSVIQDLAELESLVAKLNSAEGIVWDVETTSTDQMQAVLVGIALAVDEEEGFYVPVGHDEGEQLPLDTVVEAIRPALTNPNIPKYAHNASYDLVVMNRYGITVSPVTFDTMIAEWVRDPISRFLGLKNLARQYLGIQMTEIDELLGKGKKQVTMDKVAIDRAAPYAAADAVITYKAVNFLREALKKSEFGLGLFNELEMPIIPVIAAMEQAGVQLDTDFLASMSERLAKQLAEIKERIYSYVDGDKFNINSPKQLNEVLFEQLELPVEGLKKTSHGYSTDVNTLEILKDQHQIVQDILEYRELSKLKSTYVDALPELVNPQTQRVHTSYNQTGTSTGRFSSSNPNLQNIPIRTEIGREVRRAFVAPDGKMLLAVDYSQIELRVMAHISEDVTLIQAFKDGQDIHKATAAAVFDVSPEDVTYEQRSFAKRVNFGLMYGMGAFRLARDSNLTLAEAEGFIKTYFERLPGVERYISETKKIVRERGYVETLMGRRRYFPLLHQGKSGQRASGEERAAINMPIQGTAADILKKAMLELNAALVKEQLESKMILQVHDELVLEVPNDELQATTKLVKDIMEGAFTLKVPLVANASYGENWLDMEDVSLVV